MPVDYSKWNNIDNSDDEEKMHPNIDKDYMIRLNREKRARDKLEAEQERTEFEKQKKESEQKREDLNAKMCEAQQSDPVLFEKLRLEEEELKRQEEEFNKKEEYLKKKERLAPIDIDNISHVKFSTTSINKNQETKEDFESKMKHFGLLNRPEDSKAYLLASPQLVCEETATFLTFWCIDLEKDKKHDLMEHVAHQCMSIQFILQISKSIKKDLRACIEAFYASMMSQDKNAKEAFEEEFGAFKLRIKERLAAQNTAENEEKEKQVGPGGLDPAEVFQSLPVALQKCFESQNVELFQQTLLTMSRDEAEFYMDRCVKSGLWMPGQ